MSVLGLARSFPPAVVRWSIKPHNNRRIFFEDSRPSFNRILSSQLKLAIDLHVLGILGGQSRSYDVSGVPTLNFCSLLFIIVLGVLSPALSGNAIAEIPLPPDNNSVIPPIPLIPPIPVIPIVPIVPIAPETPVDPIAGDSLGALTKTNTRYPALVNPLGKPQPGIPMQFQPSQRGHSIQLNLKNTDNRTVLQEFSDSYFPPEKQLYWVLPGNRIVIETQGWQTSIEYQGQASRTIVEQILEVTQPLWGLQAAWILPQTFQDLVGNDTENKFSILSIAGEINNPEGVPTPSITINTDNVVRDNIQTILPPRLGTGSTYSSSGGGSLFQFLALGNTPKLLQAFPTTNLQVLLEGDGLYEGALIKKGVLGKAGINFGNPLSGEGYSFKPAVTSIPGIKVAQPDKFDNLDLLNVLVNPFLSQNDRQLYYLNSLNWVSLGLRSPKIISTKTTNIQTQDWHQLRLSRPHNRTLLQYEKTPGTATYYNVFANPGIALSYNFERGKLNEGQTANTTFGMVLGSLFELIHPARIETSIWEANLRSRRRDPFTPLRTQTTPEQRQQINQRLDRTLNSVNRVSGLNQVSGSFTWPSTITPDRSSIFQVRSGTHQRRVQLVRIQQVWQEDYTYISRLRLSDDRFGPLSFIGNVIPQSQTGLPPINRTAAVKTILTSVDGTQQFQLSNDAGLNATDLNNRDLTVVPIAIRSFDSAFDRIDLTQTGRIISTIDRFDGLFDLPSLELLWSKSRGAFNYSAAIGAWGNFSRNPAPNIKYDQITNPEPHVGLYANLLLNWTSNQVQRDANQQINALITSTPSLQLVWNSANNVSNPTTLTASYGYFRQTTAANYGITAGLFLAAYNTQLDNKLDPILFLRADLGLLSGLRLTGSLEQSTSSLFGSVEVLQSLDFPWSAGIYAQNFQTTAGLNNRSAGNAFGIIVQRQSPNNNGRWQSRLGLNGRDLELKLEGKIVF